MSAARLRRGGLVAAMTVVSIVLAGRVTCAQDGTSQTTWTYRVRVADEFGVTRTNADSPFGRSPSLWDGANEIVAAADGSWTIGDRVQSGAGLVVAAGNNRDASARVRQAFVRISAAPWLDVDGGKRLVRWGTGYAFTPTGLLDPPRDATDPQDRLGVNEGMAMVGTTMFHGDTALTVAGAAPRGWRSVATPTGRLFAAKLRTVVRGFEVSVVGSAAEGRRPSAGANFTHVIGDRFEWHGEWLRHDRASAWIARLTPDQSGVRTASALIGLQYTSPNGVNVVFEFYRDGNGLDGIAWNRLLDGARVPRSEAPASSSSITERPSLRDFVFVRAARASTTARWRPELMTIVGVDDGSVTIVPTSGWTMHGRIDGYVRAIALTGRRGSVGREAPVHATLTVGIAVRY